MFSYFQAIVTQNSTACAGVPDGSFVRNSNSCRAYYYCQNGVAHANECPENYLFEPVQQTCHIPSYVQCIGCSPFGIQNLAHPSDCTLYYSCVTGIRTLRKCGENLIFDKSIGDCNTASSGQCVKDYTQICADFGGYVKIGDPNDCSKYVESEMQSNVFTIFNYDFYQILYMLLWHGLSPILRSGAVL